MFKFLSVMILIMGLTPLAKTEGVSEKISKMVACKKQWPTKTMEDFTTLSAWLKTHLKFETCDWDRDTVTCIDNDARKVSNIKVDKKCLSESAKDEKSKMFGKCIMIAYSAYYTTKDGEIVCRENPQGNHAIDREQIIKVER